MKVLIVETRTDLPDIAGRIVSDPGCDADTVGDRDRALEYLQTDADPDLLFTDLAPRGRQQRRWRAAGRS